MSFWLQLIVQLVRFVAFACAVSGFKELPMPKIVLDEDLVRVKGTFYDFWKKEVKSGRVVRMLYWGDQLFEIERSKASDPPRHKDDLVRILDPKQLIDESVQNVELMSYVPFPVPEFAPGKSDGNGFYQPAFIKKKKKNGP